MISEQLRIGLTGSAGFLGTRLQSRFRALGWPVVTLSSSAAPTPGEVIPFRLGLPVDRDVLSSLRLDVLVHCAYDFSLRAAGDIQRVNVDGSKMLFTAASDAGIKRMIAVSTISAFPGARSLYGRAKLEIERAVESSGGVAVRPGLIWTSPGDPPGGMYGEIMRSVTARRLVPVIGHGRYPQYLVHADDLAEALTVLCDRSPIDRSAITLAHPRAISVRDLILALAASQDTAVRIVPTPWRLVWAALRLAEAAHLELPFRGDSVVSLVHQDRAPDLSGAETLGIRLRPYPNSGIRRRVRKR